MNLLPNFVKKISQKSLPKFLKKEKSLPRAVVLSNKPTVSNTVKRLSSMVKGHMVVATANKKESKGIAKKYSINMEEGSALLVFPKDEMENPIMFTGNTKSFREVQAFLYGFAPALEMDDDQLVNTPSLALALFSTFHPSLCQTF